MNFSENYSLKNHNTFGVDAKAKYFATFNSEEELADLLKSEITQKEPLFILGGGSNILLTKNFDGLVLANEIKGIEIVSENENYNTIKVGAGEVWHDFVLWSIDKNLSGIENLALIPGLVGASPMQNIGAYGVEIKDVVESVDFIEIDSGNKKTIENSACNFGYRDSIFKHELKGKVVITKVVLKLSRTPLNKTTYGAIDGELKNLNLEASPKNIAQAVINIRNSKLPDPKVLGNSGSFFKNPLLSSNDFELLRAKCEIQGFEERGLVKVSAARLIEASGWKGYRDAAVAVWHRQPLVLINTGGATATNVLGLANRIVDDVHRRYDVALDREPIEIGRP